MRRSIVTCAVAAAVCWSAFVPAQESGVQDADARTARIAAGKELYVYWCETCHGEGLGLPGFGGLPGTQQLRIKYRDSEIPAVLDERTDLVPEFIEIVVRQGVSFMPHFRKTEISDEELAAISAYLTRNNPRSTD